MVIHNVGQMIGGQIVGRFVQHFVIQYVGVDGHLAADQVVNGDVPAGFDQDADHVVVAAVQTFLNLLLTQCQRIHHIAARACIVLEIGR